MGREGRLQRRARARRGRRGRVARHRGEPQLLRWIRMPEARRRAELLPGVRRAIGGSGLGVAAAGTRAHRLLVSGGRHPERRSHVPWLCHRHADGRGSVDPRAGASRRASFAGRRGPPPSATASNPVVTAGPAATIRAAFARPIRAPGCRRSGSDHAARALQARGAVPRAHAYPAPATGSHPPTARIPPPGAAPTFWRCGAPPQPRSPAWGSVAWTPSSAPSAARVAAFSPRTCPPQRRVGRSAATYRPVTSARSRRSEVPHEAFARSAPYLDW